jgi:hypothetical protein
VPLWAAAALQRPLAVCPEALEDLQALQPCRGCCLEPLQVAAAVLRLWQGLELLQESGMHRAVVAFVKKSLINGRMHLLCCD